MTKDTKMTLTTTGKHYIAGILLAALPGCAADDYVGDDALRQANGQALISFDMGTPAVTRSHSGADAAADLGYSFAVYATKTVGETTSNVFAHNNYNATENTPYWVWYQSATANTTTSNTFDWEYVGAAGEKSIPGGTFTLAAGQEVKFWDFAADSYVFTAYKCTAGGTVSGVTTDGFTFTGTAAEVAGLYVADRLTITEKATTPAHATADNKMGDAVRLTFRSAGARVRLGIYETIPGYQVKDVTFRPTADATFEATAAQSLLSGSFNGGSAAASEQTLTVSYGTGGVVRLTTATAASSSFDFGTFDTDGDPYLGTAATAPTWAGGTGAYVSTLPNEDHVAPMVLAVDYVLYNAVTGETINVRGARAVVPQQYMAWKPNSAYTYRFKISDNTSGHTGTGTVPSGLYPITLDALTIGTTDVAEGSVTTVALPAITTYQAGSVSTEGITYANANGPIYVTVNSAGEPATLTGTTVKLYVVAAGTTEADLMLASGVEKSEVAPTAADALAVLGSSETVGSVVFAAATTAKFTPAVGNTYAFEYSDGTVTAYKVIQVSD